jgi:hypothetical protein
VVVKAGDQNETSGFGVNSLLSKIYITGFSALLSFSAQLLYLWLSGHKQAWVYARRVADD